MIGIQTQQTQRINRLLDNNYEALTKEAALGSIKAYLWLECVLALSRLADTFQKLVEKR